MISIVLPVFNGASFLDDALNSLVAQSYTDTEIIVIDDGSTDRSVDIADSWRRRDSRIKLLACEHGGAQRARNAGVAAARGAYVAHVDQDNLSLPDRLRLQLDYLTTHDLDVCGSSTWVFGDGGRVRFVPERHRDIQLQFLFETAMIHSTTMVRADVAKANPFDETATYGGLELLTRLSWRYRLGNVPQILLKYREHPGQRTRVFAEAVAGDRARFRERHFFALFPDAGPADFAAVRAVATGMTLRDDEQRALAEAWMARLESMAVCPTVRRQMRLRLEHATAAPT